MYRLLIVDDEPGIVNGLVQLFQENTQFELDVCKAYSAKEAVEIAKKKKLDILLSDIRMPQKNGLQLIDEITFYWPLCRIIFLSGYSDFDYIHEALRKNVDDYILKTEGVGPIFEAVKQASKKLDEENRRRIQEEKARMHFQIVEPFLKDELVRRVLEGEPMRSLRNEPRYEDVDFCISIDQPAFLLIGSIGRLEDATSRGLLESVQRTFDNYLPATIAREQAILGNDLLVWLLQPEEVLLSRFQAAETAIESQWNAVKVYMKGILEQVQNDCELRLGVFVSFGISGNPICIWDRIRDQYECLRSMLKNRVSAGQNMVMIDLEGSSMDEESLYECGGMRQEDVKSLVIDQIHTYVHEHLSGDISLTSIAEKVHFNPSYLSRFYKQMTGSNLLEYIHMMRLEEAIRLMEHTNLKLNEIAVRVGFDSHSYFTTFFKRKKGISPQEYRNNKTNE